MLYKCMNAAQEGRLLQLAEFLRTQVKEEEFDLRYFATGHLAAGAGHSMCGTTACALGWASVVWPETFSLYMASPTNGRLVCRGERIGVDALCIQDFFGLDRSDCVYAFGSGHHRTRKEEAVVLELLVQRAVKC